MDCFPHVHAVSGLSPNNQDMKIESFYDNIPIPFDKNQSEIRVGGLSEIRVGLSESWELTNDDSPRNITSNDSSNRVDSSNITSNRVDSSNRVADTIAVGPSNTIAVGPSNRVESAINTILMASTSINSPVPGQSLNAPSSWENVTLSNLKNNLKTSTFKWKWAQESLFCCYSSSTIAVFNGSTKIGHLKLNAENDYITCLDIIALYMPTSSLPTSSLPTSSLEENSYCIAFGTHLGWFKIYDLSLQQQVITQQFHPIPITDFKLNCNVPGFQRDEIDQLLILYHDGNVISIDALGIWMNFKMTCNYSATTQDNGMFSFDPLPLTTTSFQLNPSPESSFALGSQIYPLGSLQNSKSGPLEFGSLSNEFIPPKVESTNVVTGSPLIRTFHHHHQPDPSNSIEMVESVTKNVVKNASAFLSMASSLWDNPPSLSKLQQLPQSITFSKISPRTTISESIRQARTSIRSPSCCTRVDFIAVSDSLHRVLLYNTRLGIITKMWKGMRNVQLGWIYESLVLLLVVYYPDRGLVELYNPLDMHEIGFVQDRITYSSTFKNAILVPSSSDQIIGGMNSPFLEGSGPRVGCVLVSCTTATMARVDIIKISLETLAL